MLKTVVSSLNLSSFRAARWAAWACISYFGGFCANELVQTANGGVRFLWGHLHIGANAFTGESTCPVLRTKHYRTFFAGKGNLDHLPAFMDLNGKPYTYKQALADSRFYLRQCGYTGNHYGTHSFRIGLASEAGRLALPDWTVQLLGRWNSQCFRIYIQIDPTVLAGYAHQLRGTGI
jgi:hypothetical protein